MKKLTLFLLVGSLAFANPYPYEGEVPKDGPYVPVSDPGRTVDWRLLRKRAHDTLRVDLEWSPVSDRFQLQSVKRERSGTEALLKRALRRDPHGSYRASLLDPATGQALSHGALGTGSEFRKLTRALSFRFPFPDRSVELVLEAEDPVDGSPRIVLREFLEPAMIPGSSPVNPAGFEVRLLRQAASRPALAVNIYAEGYAASKKARFWQDAQRIVDTLRREKFPMWDRMDFHAVFGESKQTLGSAQNLGPHPVPRDSFLGLYFPHWNNFGRWYHVVYPTRVGKYRDAVGLVPYDYPIAVIDSTGYWGVGNFNELTAVPSANSSFTYLLLHEFGHFFGLNEEYEGGGPTELQFAPGIAEPWSQNITFLADTARLKWRAQVSAGTPVPTPDSLWSGGGPMGAYEGGYADSKPQGKSHKPGHSCVMKNGSRFCPVCTEALEARMKHDLGE